jgi:hypothetical protein
MKMPMKSKLPILLVTVLAINAFEESANATDLPNMIVEGTATSGAILHGDTLMPFWVREKSNFFVDLNGSYDTHNAYTIDPGIGGRIIRNNQIFGTYLFTDIDSSPSFSRFFVLSPGVEWMTTQWDAHCNVYLPTTHQNSVQNLGFPSDHGDTSHTFFSGRNQIDQQQMVYDVFGNGVDASVGYSFNLHGLRSRVFGGGYHYTAAAARSLDGFEAGIEYAVTNRISILAAASHDNVRQNNFALSLRIQLGEKRNTSYTVIDERMNDLTQRHLGTLYTASGAPIQHAASNSGATKLYRSNIWFFQPGGGAGFMMAAPITSTQCTFANPCSGLSQSAIDSINTIAPDANFYLSPGNYNVTGLDGTNTVNINSGQSIYGRQAGYINAAMGASRANIQEGILLEGSNTLDSLQIYSTNSTVNSGAFGSNVIGIASTSTATGNIALNNLGVAVADNTTGAFGIELLGNNTVNITNTTVSVAENNATTTNGAIGLSIEGNNNSVSLNSVTFNVTDSGTGGAVGINENFTLANVNMLSINNSNINVSDSVSSSFGILAAGNSNVSMKNSVVTSTTTGAASQGNAAIFVTQNSKVAVDSSIINVTDSGASMGATDFYINGTGGSLLITNSTLNATEHGTGSSYVNGINYNSGTDTVIVTNSLFNLLNDATNGGAIAIRNNSSTVGGFFSVKNSQVTVRTTNGALAFGAITSNVGALSVDGTRFVVASGSGNAVGAESDNNSSINLTNSTVNVSSSASSAFGVNNTSTSAMNLANLNFSILGNGSSAFHGAGVGVINRTNVNCIVNGTPC